MSVPADCAVLAQAFPSAFANISNCCTSSLPRFLKVQCTNGRVTSLSLKNAKLASPLPESLGSLTELVELELSSTSLTGSIPASLGSLTKLRMLDLNSNNLSGPLPAIFGNMSSLGALGLGYNSLSGRSMFSSP
ncbi:hypothetical protein BC831DRAFT_188767 [Entophlyctis helioformis]|nr:hypothetical protein BC831DRAFT_188767 [Entophlyctis helioformis]